MAGRFAPSPTGPLHAGSLIAALAARCAAVHSGGEFLVRMDDLDVARAQPGAAVSIIRTLHRFGLIDDRTTVTHQSDGLERYHDALRRLARQDLLYACDCSRRVLAGRPGCVGRCRDRHLTGDGFDARLSGHPGTTDQAVRVRLQGQLVFDDAYQGRQEVDLASDVGDIVVHRRDGIVAWPLATACDDAMLSDVVRGADLLAPTAAQIALIDRLGSSAPRYAHVPVLLDSTGSKLGKSTGADAIDDADPLALLNAAWRFLGQWPLGAKDIDAFHRAACEQFDQARVPRVASRQDACLASVATAGSPRTCATGHACSNDTAGA